MDDQLYTMECALGSDGRTRTYPVEGLKLRRTVALKVLRPKPVAILQHNRFQQVTNIVAKLTHPHVLPVNDSGDTDGFLHDVMPYIEGESSQDQRRQTLGIKRADTPSCG